MGPWGSESWTPSWICNISFSCTDKVGVHIHHLKCQKFLFEKCKGGGVAMITYSEWEYMEYDQAWLESFALICILTLFKHA